MLHIVINKQRYPLPASWQELDLQQARCLIRCSQLLNTSHPDRSDNCPEKDKVTISLLVELCRIPRHIASHTQPQERLIFARRILYKLGNPAGYTTDQNQADHTDILSGQTAHPPRFHWHGEWLRYPETDRDINGEPMPMYRITAGEFCEATDLYLAGAWDYAPLITAILCRPAGERYDEQRARHRAETMQRLPLTVIRHLFRLLNPTHRYLQQMFPCCYTLSRLASGTKQPGRKLKCTLPTTWNDMLFEAAGYLPSEITTTREMPLYPFMQLLHAKCKRQARVSR